MLLTDQSNTNSLPQLLRLFSRHHFVPTSLRSCLSLMMTSRRSCSFLHAAESFLSCHTSTPWLSQTASLSTRTTCWQSDEAVANCWAASIISATPPNQQPSNSVLPISRAAGHWSQHQYPESAAYTNPDALINTRRSGIISTSGSGLTCSAAASSNGTNSSVVPSAGFGHNVAQATSFLRTYSSGSTASPEALDPAKFTEDAFHKVADPFLSDLRDVLEEATESLEQQVDVEYSQGVLTVAFGGDVGTYVINKQAPNRQLWLSSPVSGPARFNYFSSGQWLHARSGVELLPLLQAEFAAATSASGMPDVHAMMQAKLAADAGSAHI